MTVRQLIEKLLYLDLDKEIEVAVYEWHSDSTTVYGTIDHVCDWCDDDLPRIICNKE